VANQISEWGLASWPGLRRKTLHYVLLRHSLDTRDFHYDLMLELRPGGGSSARTLWGLQRTDLPKRGARRMEWRTHGMHRRRYLTFKGDLGKNRGSVERIDRGQYCVAQVGGRLTLEIAGKLLSGRFTLLRSGYGRHVWIRAEYSRRLDGSR
jgi:hypothetical protein